jgi:invasion protein IalB
MKRRLSKSTVVCALLLGLFAPFALAQVTPGAPTKPTVSRKPAPAPAPTPAPAAQPAAQAPPAAPAVPAPPPPEWVSHCASEGRQGALDCLVEQTAFLSKTGQLVTAVVIRVPAETRQPVMNIQVPVGLFIPAGIGLRIDDAKPVSLTLQTCDLKGCYAAAPVSPEMLAALKAGKELTITFQNLGKEAITVPLQLTGFAAAYQRIQ